MWNINYKGIELVVDGDYEREEGDDWHEPKYPSSFTLSNCYVGSVDIYDLLSDSQIRAIEDLALEEIESAPQEPEDY